MMERAGTKETNLAIAWIKDAIHLLESNYKNTTATWKTDITKATSSVNNKYPMPANMINLSSISIYDTTDKKYKKIRRMSVDDTVTEDTSPND